MLNSVFQIADGMNYLTQNKCIFRGLCAEKVLIGENLSIKITGFEVAVIVKNITEYFDGNILLI